MTDAAERANGQLDVLVVGAGPTGLALAVQLCRFGMRMRIIDRLVDRGRESRALAIQARTLEVLQGAGLGEQLVARGRPATQLVLHLEDRTASLELGGFRAADTRFPFILFLSQAETEVVLGQHLADRGVRIERGVELVRFAEDETALACMLRHEDGREESVRASFLVGCDGAHSTVRKGAGIDFAGGSYTQDFLLGDVESDGAGAGDRINAFAHGGGVALFFPLGHPTTWRVIALDAQRGRTVDRSAAGALTLPELQAVVDVATAGQVQLRDPVWLSRFHLSHRQTSRYRAGRVFLAGDAAHIHSPVGAQGMNTGIQDAWNLGWKLAFVVKGWAAAGLLDSYEAERWAVGRALLRTTDRAFGLFVRGVSAGRLATWLRREVVGRVLPRLLAWERLRTWAFRFVSELRIAYRRSPIVAEGEPRLTRGPRAGDRLPDAAVMRDGKPAFLQQELSAPACYLLLCGDPDAWDTGALVELAARHAGLLKIVTLARRPDAGHGLVDAGEAFDRLGVERTAQYLVRPDGYIAFRCAGTELRALEAYLSRWFSSRTGGRR